MTKVRSKMRCRMRHFVSVSADVSFSSNHFPRYKIGPDNQIVEDPSLDLNALSLKEVVAKEIAKLTHQHERLFVHLTTKFDKNLSATAKLSELAKLGEFASLEGHVLLKKLRDALESLRGRLADCNKKDVEKAISMTPILSLAGAFGRRFSDKTEKGAANFFANSLSFHNFHLLQLQTQMNRKKRTVLHALPFLYTSPTWLLPSSIPTVRLHFTLRVVPPLPSPPSCSASTVLAPLHLLHPPRPVLSLPGTSRQPPEPTPSAMAHLSPRGSSLALNRL